MLFEPGLSQPPSKIHALLQRNENATDLWVPSDDCGAMNLVWYHLVSAIDSSLKRMTQILLSLAFFGPISFRPALAQTIRPHIKR